MSLFDHFAYLERYPEVAGLVSAGRFAGAEHHWWSFGRHEGFEPSFVEPGIARVRTAAPRVSVVMPVYEGERFLAAAIDSVLAQTEGDFELIIVDDGSRDSTPEIMWRYAAKDPRVSLLWKPNGGTGSALNMGFEYATGRYQTWSAADNELYPKAFEELAGALDRDEDAVLAYSDFVVRDETTGKEELQRPPEYDKRTLRRFCYLGVAWLFRREAKERAGKYSLAVCEDYDMHLRLSDLGPFVRVPKTLGMWRGHGKNLSTVVCAPAGWRQAVTVQASHQWKKAPERILRAVLPGHDCRTDWYLLEGLAQLSDRYAMREARPRPDSSSAGYDLIFGDDSPEIGRLALEATFLHLDAAAESLQTAEQDILPWLSLNRRTVLQIHGSLDRKQLTLAGELRTRLRLPMAFTCPLAAAALPGTLWLPPVLPVDTESGFLDRQRFLPRTGEPMSPPRFATNREAGAGRRFAGLTAILSSVDPKLSSELCAGDRNPLPYRESIERLRGCDIFVERSRHGTLSRSAFEALALGLVVLARIDPSAEELYRETWDGEPPPIVRYDEDASLAEEIARLCRDRALLLEWRRRVRAWSFAHLDAKLVLRKHEAFYDRALVQEIGEAYALPVPSAALPALGLSSI